MDSASGFSKQSFFYTQSISRIRAVERAASPMSIVAYVTEGESRRSTHPKLERRRVYRARFKFLGLAAFVMMLAILLFSIHYSSHREIKEAFSAGDQTIGSTALSLLGGAYELIDHTGKVRTNKDFIGTYQLVYFGYSYCPDICPTALSAITLALENLGKLSAHIVPIFITIDPERDTPSHLKVYKESFHPAFVALTGNKEHIQQAQKAFRVYAQKVAPDGTMNDYLMDHSSLIYLLDRNGKCIAVFSHTSSPRTLSEKIKEVMAHLRDSLQ